MVTSSIGIVLCRIGAVLLFVQSATSLQYVLPALLGYGGDLLSPIVIFTAGTATPAIAGIGLWYFSERICSINIGSADVEIRTTLQALDLVAIGTLLIGLYAVFRGLVGGLTTEALIWSQVLQTSDIAGGPDVAAHSFLSARISYASQIVLGLLLIIGRQKIANLLWKLRYAGIDTKGQD